MNAQELFNTILRMDLPNQQNDALQIFLAAMDEGMTAEQLEADFDNLLPPDTQTTQLIVTCYMAFGLTENQKQAFFTAQPSADAAQMFQAAVDTIQYYAPGKECMMSLRMKPPFEPHWANIMHSISNAYHVSHG